MNKKGLVLLKYKLNYFFNSPVTDNLYNKICIFMLIITLFIYLIIK